MNEVHADKCGPGIGDGCSERGEGSGCERMRASLGGTIRQALMQLRQFKGPSLVTVAIVPMALDHCLGSAQVGEFQRSQSRK